MEGTKEHPGINYRTMKELFRCIDEEREGEIAYEITASIAELYNEQVAHLTHRQSCNCFRVQSCIPLHGARFAAASYSTARRPRCPRRQQ